ncbi:hypothetical protein [Pseudoxanthomonas sp. UTMC 1351]|uniref:hypothetical protein n=1 Tax=Pseudoxanthomonas sp. UTMC 1351 TaxID=2695853 RepID=UPI0034D01FEE
MGAAVWPLLLALSSSGAHASGLIGKIVPPYPEGLHDAGGSCISESDDYAHVCDYSIGVLAAGGGEGSQGDEAEPTLRYVVAAKMAGRDGQSALWKITDAQPYPKAEEGYQLQFGSCRVHGKDDERLAAVVRQSMDQEYLQDVIWARRLDLPSGKLVEVQPSAVDCINEAYFGL